MKDLKDVYFAAIVTEGGWDVKVYIVNATLKALKISIQQGSFAGDMDGVSSLGHSRYRNEVVPAQGTLQIDHMDDIGQLDFTTYYNIKVGQATYVDQINGSVVGEASWVDIPIMNQRGYLHQFTTSA